MNKIKEWLLQLTKDERGSASVKPVIAIMGSLFLCVTMVIQCFTHLCSEPSAVLVDAVVIITAIGMGADSLDKFSFKNKVATKPEPKKPNTKDDPEV
jgi:hypothetical protein